MNERLIAGVSDAELQRRWAAAERVMRDAKLDALVVQNSNDWLGGYVRWFTGVPANNAYPRTVLFFGAADMAVIEMGNRGDVLTPDPGEQMWRGVTRAMFNPSFSAVSGTLAVDARLAADELTRRGAKRIGWVNPDGMYQGFARPLETASAGFSFTDATAGIDLVKAVKSAEEQALIRRTAALQDEVMAAVAAFVKPGLHDFEVAAYAQYEAQQRGAEQGIFIGSSSPAGKAAVFRPRHMQGRRIEHGDVFSLLVETNGPGGYYTELGRTFSLGRPANSLVVANRDAIDAQKRNLEMLKPGVRVADIFANHNQQMRTQGLPPETRLHCHGQGYDMVERPLIRDDDDMTILQDMNIVVHPGYISDEAFALVCDNYVIGADGPGPCLHRTDQRLITL
jgi:Xaa-Pro aminopeptidase